MYASKSEKTTKEDKKQAVLFDEIEKTLVKHEKASTIKVKSHRRKKVSRKPIPKDISRKEILLDLSDEEKTCECGCQRAFIKDEISEKIDIIPEQVFVRRYTRKLYACKKCEGTANENKPAVRSKPIPENIIPQSQVSAGLIAHIVTRKFEYALLFYRQEKLFNRLGIDISRVKMCQWSMNVAQKLEALVKLIEREICKSPTIGIDETRVQVMKEPGKRNQENSYMWVFLSPTEKLVTYNYSQSRGATTPINFLGNFKGNIMTNDFSGYSPVSKLDGIQHSLCWAHTKRYFHKAAKESSLDSESNWYLRKINQLYRVERIIREKNMNDDETVALRQRLSKPIMNEIKMAFEKHLINVQPESLIGKAIKYLDKSFKKFTNYLSDGTIPIDNNMTENAIRPFVIGRKNWLFSGSPRGAKASATFYSIIESAKMNGFDPYWYLRLLLAKVCHKLDEKKLFDLLPNQVTVEQIEEFKKGVLA